MKISGTSYGVMGRGERRVIDLQRNVSHAKAGDTFPWSKMSFGYALAGGADVTIYGGEIQIGASAIVTVADTTLTLDTDYCFVGIRYTYSTKVLEIVDFKAAITPNGTTLQKWFYQFRLQSSIASLHKIGWLNPVIPSIYADEPT